MINNYLQKVNGLLSNYMRDYTIIKNNKKIEKFLEVTAFGICGLSLWYLSVVDTSSTKQAVITIVSAIIGVFVGLFFIDSFQQKKLSKLTEQLQQSIEQHFYSPEDYFLLIFELEELYKNNNSENLKNTIIYFKKLVNQHGKINIEDLLLLPPVIEKLSIQNNKQKEPFSYDDFIDHFKKQQFSHQEKEIGKTEKISNLIKNHL